MNPAVAVPQQEQSTEQQFLYKHLISDELWERLVGRIVKDEEVERDEAEQIMDAGLGFMKLCADHPGNRFAPSEQADIGWHTFLMYTKAYHAFCDRYADRFIHHEPNDRPGREPGRNGLVETIHFMIRHNVPFNPSMWMDGVSATDLSQTSREELEGQLQELVAGSPCDSCGCSPPDEGCWSST